MAIFGVQVLAQVEKNPDPTLSFRKRTKFVPITKHLLLRELYGSFPTSTKIRTKHFYPKGSVTCFYYF